MPAGKSFLDTNILAYAFDLREPRKRPQAIELVATLLREQRGVLSFQVAQEFLNVAIKGKVPGLQFEDAHRFLYDVVVKLELVLPTFEILERGLYLRERYELPWYDSLMVASALSIACEVLYTEDLNHGQVIEGTTIINPFA